MYMCAKEHPFCASKIWVLPLMDQVYIPQDIMAWLTLTTVGTPFLLLSWLDS
jgi:hypothetical protein